MQLQRHSRTLNRIEGRLERESVDDGVGLGEEMSFEAAREYGE